ncbi:thioredoxin family protein [Stenotrophomonas sp. PD6]|uniref:thioredoxin family protein n=1 Tax=Stenotrophomonas sp. PD6 TaxID=3368612 RepID=UPI003BA026DC
MLTLYAESPEHYYALLGTHPDLLVDFHKDNCPGCRMLEMSLAAFAATPQAEGRVLLKVKLEDVGEAFFRTLGLRQTPTLSVVRGGHEIARLPGFQSPEHIAAAVTRR